MLKVFIVDDELELLDILSINLRSEGYYVVEFSSGNAVINHLLNSNSIPDLIILDIMMNGINGFDVCRKIRSDERYKNIPIIYLSAKSEVHSRIRALELGGDDYITKPFSIKELLLRVKAVINRTSSKPNDNNIKNVFTYKGLTLLKDSFTSTLNGHNLKLTKTEFKILLLFFENPKRFFSRDEIINRLWANDSLVVDRTVDVHIQRLRKKLEDCKTFILTYPGVGYGYSSD